MVMKMELGMEVPSDLSKGRYLDKLSASKSGHKMETKRVLYLVHYSVGKMVYKMDYTKALVSLMERKLVVVLETLMVQLTEFQ